MNNMNRQNNRTLKEELPRSVGAQYVTGDQWRNNSRKNEGMEPKQKQYPVVDVTGDRSKVRRCKEQYCVGTWKVRFMNQGKLEVVKQEMAIPDHLTCLLRNLCEGQEATAKTGQGAADGFQIGKEVCQDCIVTLLI